MTTTTRTHSPRPVIVCATTGTTPLVVLADGSYATSTERVFWQDLPQGRLEVLRVPLDRPVVMHPVGHLPAVVPAVPTQRRPLPAPELTPAATGVNNVITRLSAVARAVRDSRST